ncbi:MAG TPA: hypothetical protein ENI87_06200, partial [bacterium]|nr:hypothetical protein [bacterium]
MGRRGARDRPQLGGGSVPLPVRARGRAAAAAGPAGGRPGARRQDEGSRRGVARHRRRAAAAPGRSPAARAARTAAAGDRGRRPGTRRRSAATDARRPAPGTSPGGRSRRPRGHRILNRAPHGSTNTKHYPSYRTPTPKPSQRLQPMSAKNDFDKKIKSLIKAQRKVGSVTLAQLNSVLPDDMTSPEHIEGAIALIEDAGLEVVEDEKAQTGKKKARKNDVLDDGEDVDLTPGVEIAEPSEAELAAPVVDITEKIDDPVRMYLTQMGEIPLLTREEEISLARKIELTRKQFRKEVLSSGFGMKNAIEILEDVLRGELAFDRTLKVNQQDPEVGKADLSDRLPGNIQTLQRIYDAARQDFAILFEGKASAAQQRVLKRRIFSRRRKAVALIEELNLQGKKVRPMIDLVESRIAEMKRLQNRLARYRGAQLQNPDAIETRRRLAEMQLDGL